MKKSVFVTAVTGSGKSTVCRELNKLGYNAVDIEDIPGLFSLVDEKTGLPMPEHDNSDLDLVKQGDWICNPEKLRAIVDSETSNLSFYCGAASNYEEIWGLFDQVLYLTVSNGTTLDRLSTRKLGQYGNSPEVRDWILTWKQDLENKWAQLGAVAIRAEEGPGEVAQKIVAATTSPAPHR